MEFHQVTANKYEALSHTTHSEADGGLSSGDADLVARTLIAISLNDEDWRWVQQHALQFLTHESDLVVSAAILSLGHTAGRNRSIDKHVVIPALQHVATHSRYAGKVQDAIDDIEMYVISAS